MKELVGPVGLLVYFAFQVCLTAKIRVWLPDPYASIVEQEGVTYEAFFIK